MTSNPIENLVAAAVTEGLAARSAFYLAIAEPDEQKLGDPASTDDLQKLESFLGKSLPPSYKAFLAMHDGWRMFDAATDLLSAKEVVKQTASSKLEKWRKIATEVEGIEASSWLLIGTSNVSATKYFLDPTRIHEDGEMAVVEHDKAVESEYVSFLSLLVESNGVYRDGAKEIDGGFDFTNV